MLNELPVTPTVIKKSPNNKRMRVAGSMSSYFEAPLYTTGAILTCQVDNDSCEGHDIVLTNAAITWPQGVCVMSVQWHKG